MKKKIITLVMSFMLLLASGYMLVGCNKHTHEYLGATYYTVEIVEGVEKAYTCKDCDCGEVSKVVIEDAVIVNNTNAETKIASAESGSTIILTEGDYPLISLKGVDAFQDNITIVATNNVKVDGLLITSGLKKQEYETKSSVMAENLSIKNINFIDDIQLRNCTISGLSIKDCKFTGEARINLDANNYGAPYATVITAIDGDMIKFGYDDIQVGNTTNSVINVTIENNTFDGVHDSLLKEATVIYLSSIDGATVRNNIVNCAEFNGIQITSNCNSTTGKILVEGNTIKNTGSRSMRFSYFEDEAELIVKNNVLSNANTLEGNPEVIKSSGTGEASIVYEGNTYNGEAISIGNNITKA